MFVCRISHTPPAVVFALHLTEQTFSTASTKAPLVIPPGLERRLKTDYRKAVGISMSSSRPTAVQSASVASRTFGLRESQSAKTAR